MFLLKETCQKHESLKKNEVTVEGLFPVMKNPDFATYSNKYSIFIDLRAVLPTNPNIFLCFATDNAFLRGKQIAIGRKLFWRLPYRQNFGQTRKQKPASNITLRNSFWPEFRDRSCFTETTAQLLIFHGSFSPHPELWPNAQSRYQHRA